VRAEIERWLLATFAVSVSTDTGTYPRTSHSRIFKADRYGAVGGSAHGGSGRCAYLGRFNIKGVGPTPLVPPGLQSHSDGRLFLIDAIREAIYAEICHAESIKGAVRTVAIIGMGGKAGDTANPHCLIVRPNFVRPAHFERSLYFGTAGTKQSDQFKDAERVEAVKSFVAEGGSGLISIVGDLANQFGSLDAMRMVQGKYTSSNVSLSGEVADFGSFRFLRNWRYMRFIKSDQDIFGKDMEYFKRSAIGWAKIFALPAEERGTIVAAINQSHRSGFVRIIEAVLGDGEIVKIRDKICDMFYKLYLQGAKGSNFNDGWLFPEPTSVFDKNLLLPLRDFIAQAGISTNRASSVISKTALWVTPRKGILYSEVNSEIKDLLISSNTMRWPRRIADLIRTLVSKNRRVFCGESNDYTPIGHYWSSAMTVRYMLERASGQHYAFVYTGSGAGVVGRGPGMRVECDRDAASRGWEVRLADQVTNLPAADVIYRNLFRF
jgi:hypothetical protein